MCLVEEKNIIVSGGGDDLITIIDLTTKSVIRALSGILFIHIYLFNF